MQPSSWSRRLSSIAICASRRGRHEFESRSQSRWFGVRAVGQRRQRVADLLEREPDLLRDPDERDAPDHVAGVATLPAVGAGRVQQTLGLVEPQRGGRDAGALAQRADRQLVLELHDANATAWSFKRP